MSVRIIEGDALAVLRTLESESVQLVCTSPPYFGLRAYGTNPQVWGGDPAHDHEWGDDGHKIVQPTLSANTTLKGGAGAHREPKAFTPGSFCACGAWRGELGSEPKPALFIEHLLTIFDEVGRVLRRDGLLFVNLAPSYAGSGKGPTGKSGIGDQAKRQGFVGDAATSDQSRSLSLGHAPACGSGGRERSNSRRLGSSCSDLCDGCLADFLSHRDRSVGIHQRQQSDVSLPLTIDRDSARLDSSLTTLDASAHDARASTKLESWLQLRGECSRCESRQAAFVRLGLPIGEPVALESAHRTGDPYVARLSSGAIQDQPSSTAYRAGTDDALVGRIAGMDADSFSCQDYTKLDRHWKPKDLILIPEMFALGMQARGWYVRQQIVWAKKAPMPESVKDRFTRSWEPIWMFSKSPRYFFDQEAVRAPLTEPSRLLIGRTTRPGVDVNGGGQGNGAMSQNAAGANMRDVWLLGPEPSSLEHYAGFVTELPRRCILAGTSERGCCSACGAPWARVVERTKGREIEAPKLGQLAVTGMSSNGTGGSTLGIGGRGHGGAWEEHGSKSVTTGWAPSCKCSRTTTDSTIVRDFVREWFGGNNRVYGVWEAGARQAVKGGTYKILLPDLREDRVVGSASSTGNGIQEGQHTPALSGREDDGCEGVRVPPSTGASDGESERLCTGAPFGLGEGERPRSDPERTRDPSPERDHWRQQAGELDGDAAQAARDLPSRQGSTGSSEGSGSGTTGAQGSNGDFLVPYPPRPCVVLDPFAGSGTTLMVASRLGRSAIGVELNPEYCRMAEARIQRDAGPMFPDAVQVTAAEQACLWDDAEAAPAPLPLLEVM